MGMSDRHLLAIKRETTQGTDAFSGVAPTEWLSIVGEPEIQESVVEIGPDEKTADGLGGQILKVGEKTDVSFEAYLVGKDGAAGDPPPGGLSDLFLGCNLAETITATTDVGYDLVFGRMMATVPSFTVYEAIRDDVTGDYHVRVVTGVRGVPTFKFEDGGDARVSFEGVGKYSELSEAATETIANPTQYSGGKNRLKIQGMGYSLGGSQFGITALELTTGMSVDEDKDLTASEAVDKVGLHLANGDKPGGSNTFKSEEFANVLPLCKPTANGVAPTGELSVTLTDGTDTIQFIGAGAVVGAYSKSLAGGNYNYETPMTCLDGLSLIFT